MSVLASSFTRQAAPNNSFNRSANGAAFIVDLPVSAVRRARLIRALGCLFLNLC